MVRYMYIVKADNASETPGPLPVEALEMMTTYNEQLNDAGILLDAEGLWPTAVDTYKLKYSAGAAADVTTGPFDTNSENHICGYWIVNTKSAEEALEWAKKCPFPAGEITMRKVTEVDEMASTMSDSLKARAAKIVADVAARSAAPRV